VSWIAIFVSYVLVNNLVFTYFLGLSPVMDTSRGLREGALFALVFTLFLAITTVLARIVHLVVLEPLKLGFLQTVVFVLLAVAVVRLADYLLQRVAPLLRRRLEPNRTVMMAQCATVGMMLIVVRHDYTVRESLMAGVAAGIGILLATALVAGVREQLDREWIPKPFRGAPIAFISAGLIAMALLAFDRALLINLFG